MSNQAENLNQIFLVALGAFAGRTCLRVKHGPRYRSVSYRQIEDDALRVARFLRRQGIHSPPSPGSGIEVGPRVAISAEISAEWLAAYLGCLFAGGVAVPLPTSTSPADFCFMLQDSGASVAVVEGREQLRYLDQIAGELPGLNAVLVIDGAVDGSLPATSFSSLRGDPLPAKGRQRLRGEAESVPADALASIHYTAQELGRPRGAVFDHGGQVETMRCLGEWMNFDRDDQAFTVLPWAYPPSLLLALRCLLSGVPNVLAGSRGKMFDDLRQASPTLAMVTPYGLERFYNRVMSGLSELPRSRRDVFRWALSIGRQYRAAGAAGPAELREGYARADRTFFSQIRAELGGRLRRVYSVGAPLPPHVAEFAEAIGIEPFSLYSLTDAGGFPAISRPGNRCPGACGRVGAGYQIRIAGDGEVLVRGDTVMREYWRRPEETRQATARGGWLRTGDLGRFDQEGNLYLTGHKRSRFVLSTGRTVMPTRIEAALVASPLVAQAIVFGDGRPFVTALVVPDLTAVAALMQEAGEAGDTERTAASGSRVIDPSGGGQMEQLLERVRQKVNRKLDGWEQVEKLTLLDEPLSAASGELNVSMTANRQVVAERHAAQIDAMYPKTARLEQLSSDGQPAEGEVTQIRLDPEQLRELFEKQDILDAWMADAGIGFLFEIARAKAIHPPAMVHICETAAAVAQMQSEERPLSTALIVGDPSRIARILPESEIQLQRYDHIRRMRRVVIGLAEMVDGLVLGFVLDLHGYVRGIYKLEVALDDDTGYLLGPRFRHHAAISRHCGAMVFFVPNGGRQVRVFSGGQLVGRYANGYWSTESVERVDRTLEALAAAAGYDLALLRRLLRCAFRMSEQNLGAIFLLGDAEAVLRQSDPPAVSAFANISSAPVASLSDSELINFAKQDGATVIDASGVLRGCKVLLRPAAETKADIGTDKGARHSSAAKMSAEADCLAITVSQDGPITAYQGGRRVFSL